MKKKRSEPLSKGKKQGKRRGKTVTPHGDHVAGSPPCVGGEERMVEHCRFALKMRMRGMALWQISDEMAREFGIYPTPSPSSVSIWISQARMEAIGEIKALAVESAAQSFMELEQLKNRWMPVALQEGLAVNRMTMMDGEMVPVLDENAYDEGLKAANLVVKINLAQQKLLTFTREHTGDGPQTETAVQEWFMEFLQRGSGIVQPPEAPKMLQGITVDVTPRKRPAKKSEAQPVPQEMHSALEVDHGLPEFEEL